MPELPSIKVKVGEEIDGFKILKYIGGGGMGVVYLALEKRLHRKVALKFIKPEFANKEYLVSLFRQEAITASAINHPHMMTIHGVHSVGDLHFIIMEYVKGQTLEDRISEGGIKLHEVVKISLQVAAALAHAHSAEPRALIHRDIKPANIMLRDDGIVKVLDFGVAKLIKRPVATKDGATFVLDAKSGLKGTPWYMSPEQWEGRPLDGKTDVFSLGVVIYEMITGLKPFQGTNVRESIKHTEPAPLSRFVPGIHPELQDIVSRALCKDRSKRYSSKELFNALTKFQRDAHLYSEVEAAESEREVEQSGTDRSRENGGPPPPGPPAPPPDVIAPSPASSSARQPQRLSRVIIIAICVGLAVFAGLAVATYLYAIRPGPPAPPQSAAAETPSPTLKIKDELTNTDNITLAAISPDGSTFVYGASDAAGNQSLWLGYVGGGDRSPVPIVRPAQVVYDALTFSRDGNGVYYVRYERNNSVGDLYYLPVLGGAASRLMKDVPRPFSFTFSPDGRQFAFVRYMPDKEESWLIVANTSGSREERVLAKRREILRYTGGPPLHFLGGPVWSPDGKLIAWALRSPDDGTVKLVCLREDGSEVLSIAHGQRFVRQISWLSSHSLLVLSASKEYGPYKIWSISYPSGAGKQISNDLYNYQSISLTQDLSTLVAVQDELTAHVWIAQVGAEDNTRRIISERGKHNDFWGFAWSQDGKILFERTRRGDRQDVEQDIWVMNSDGGGQMPLTASAGGNFDPSLTADGRSIVFASDRAGRLNIWKMDIDGGNPQQLTSGLRDFAPYCTRDGRWVVYTSEVSGRLTLWRVPLGGGPPVQLTTQTSQWPAASPNGNHIACFYEDERARAMKLAILPFDGGRPTKMFNISPTVNTWAEVRWTPDGRSLTYIDTKDGISNIWSTQIETGQLRQLTHFRENRIFRYEWAADGQHLVLSRGTIRRNVLLMALE